MSSIAFSIGSFDIAWYSIYILIGVILGGILFLLEAKKYDIDMDFCINMIFWTVIFGIIGARAYYVLFNLDYYMDSPKEIIEIWNGGLAIHGGLLGGLFFMLIYTLKYKVRILKITDMAVVGLIIAQSIGRWGNFFNQEAHGPKVTREVLESIGIIPKFVINGMNIGGEYFHPTFYYEFLWCLLGFIVLLLIRKFYKYLKVGQLTGVYLIWYSIGRFFIEGLRTDSLMLGSIKAAQLVSIVLILNGIILLLKDIGKSRFENLYDDYEVEDVRF